MESPDSNVPAPVCDKESALAFIRWCVDQLGLGYHPDTPFTDYVDEHGASVFSDTDARRLDREQDAAFQFCDPYEIGLQEFRRIVPALGTDVPTD